MLTNTSFSIGLGLLALAVASTSARDEPHLISAGRISAAAAYSSSHGGLALLIQQNGRTLSERYNGGHTASTKYRIYSGTKGFWGLAALKADEDDLLDLDDRASKHLPEWKADPDKYRITLEQLLDFSSGLEARNLIHEDDLKDRNLMAIEAKRVATPGRSFIYGPAALQVFHEVLKRRLLEKGDRPYTYLERQVLQPMGLGSQRYIPDQSGNPLLAAGFMMTARQWAQIGTVLIQEGRPVLSERSFDRLSRGSSANRAYNLGFWNNRAADARHAREVNVEDELGKDWWTQNWKDACLCKDAPEDLLACIGSNSQRLYAVPSLKLVIVRQGRDQGFSDADFLRLLFPPNPDRILQ